MQHFSFFLFFILALGCTPTYKVNTSVYNSTKETITTIGIQKGYTVNPKNQPNVVNSTPLLSKGTHKLGKKIKIRKGESLYLYVSTDKTDGLQYAGAHRFENKEKNYTFPITKIDTTKAFTEEYQIKSKLNQIGITDIDKGSRIKMEIITSDIGNILSYLPGLIIVDTSKIRDNKIPDNALARTYYRPKELGIIPDQLKISGNTIKDNFSVESNGSLSSQFNVPLFSNLNLGISNKGYYKVVISIKEAGWIPVTAQNMRTPLESIFRLDSLGALNTLADMYDKLSTNTNNRLFTVEEAFVFSELVAQTSEYTESNAVIEGGYANVITTKGAYIRSEQADHIDTRPTTLMYVSLTNNKTGAAKIALEKILLKDYIAKYLSGQTQNLEVLKAIQPVITNQLKGYDREELKALSIQLEKEIEKQKKTLKP